MQHDTHGNEHQVGVVSWGIGCSRNEISDLYALVPPQVSLIKTTTRLTSEDQVAQRESLEVAMRISFNENDGPIKGARGGIGIIKTGSPFRSRYFDEVRETRKVSIMFVVEIDVARYRNSTA